jgi:hypothetical protein
MPLAEVVILNPRRPAAKRKSSKRKKSVRSKNKGMNKMARRKSAKRVKSTRRKTTTRRRASPKRKATTRRRKVTRRKAAPKRRKTTRRKTARRKTARRKAAPKRRKTTRRKTTRRKAAPKRRRTTRRKKTTRRKSSPRRKTTTRRRRVKRRAAPKRRKTTRRKTARRKTARRKSTSRVRRSRKSSKKMSFKGYTSFVKNHMDLRGLGIVVLGLSLPSMAGYLASTSVGMRAMNYVDMVPGMSTNVGKAALAVGLTAAVSYGMTGLGVISASEALTANMIALGLVTVGALQSMSLPVGGNIVSSLPSASVLAGLGGASYGYIGNYHDTGMGVGAEMLPQPQSQQLFGVRANIF